MVGLESGGMRGLGWPVRGVIWSTEVKMAVETVPWGLLGIEFRILRAKPKNWTLEAVWRGAET